MNARIEELIELYFANALSAAENTELKQLLASDPAAAAEFAWQLKLSRQISKRSLAKGIQNDNWREAAKPPFRQASMMRSVMAAAAALALLVVAYLFLPRLTGNDHESLVAASFEHFPNKMKFKNLGAMEESVSPEVLEAFAAYDKKNYEQAALKLDAIVNANPERLDYRFYLGVAAIGAKHYPESINALVLVAQNKNSLYSTPALYYLGVAYAGIKDAPQAKKYLQDYIAENDDAFRLQAETLLKGLK